LKKKTTVKELEVFSNVLDLPLIALLHGVERFKCFKDMRMERNANGISIRFRD